MINECNLIFIKEFYFVFKNNHINNFFYFLFKYKINYILLGIGDWGLGIGDWGLGPIPNPQTPIPKPQIPKPKKKKNKLIIK